MTQPPDSSADAAALVLELDAAFSNLPYPGDDQIVTEPTDGDIESERIKATLCGRHWRDLPFDTLRELRSALAFLTPAGYRFYLPAFMVFSITDFRAADVLPDEVILTLTPPRDADLNRLRAMANAEQLQPALSTDEVAALLAGQEEAHHSGRAAQQFLQRTSGFDARQRSAIRRFLEYMQDEYGEEFPYRQPQAALDRFWSS